MIDLYHTISKNTSRNITRTYSTSFSFGISLLDKSIHDAIYSIYGFVRLADEIVDTFHDFPKQEMLLEFKNETYKALDRGISTNPVLHAFQMVVNEFNIHRSLIDKFLDSMEKDLKEINSIKEHDMVVTFAIRNYLDYNDLHYESKDISKIVEMGAAVSRFYKNKFQRIRPWQLAGELGIDINHIKFPSDTMQTPSYPSGHSLQSRLVAEHYIEIYPQHKKGLVEAAEECGIGRVKAGWHFPSDHDAAILIATEIAPMVKL